MTAILRSWSVAFGLLLTPLLGAADTHLTVKDAAQLFSAAGVTAAAKALPATRELGLTVETIAALAADQSAKWAQLKTASDRQAFWSTRAEQHRANATDVYIVICQQPTDLAVIVSPAARALGFDPAHAAQVQTALALGLWKTRTPGNPTAADALLSEVAALAAERLQKTVPVLVVLKPIPAGTHFGLRSLEWEQEHLASQRIPLHDQRVKLNPWPNLSLLANQRAKRAIAAGEVVGADAVEVLAPPLEVTPGKLAFKLTTSFEHSVVPAVGSTVSVFGIEPPRFRREDDNGERALLRDVKTLAVQTTSKGPTPASTFSAILEVTPREAQLMALADTRGQLFIQPSDSVPVLVAHRDIPAGQLIDKVTMFFRVRYFPAKLAPNNPLTAKALRGQTTVQALTEGQLALQPLVAVQPKAEPNPKE
jgi:Flp pilus assembly protein CpaB